MHDPCCFPLSSLMSTICHNRATPTDIANTTVAFGHHLLTCPTLTNGCSSTLSSPSSPSFISRFFVIASTFHFPSPISPIQMSTEANACRRRGVALRWHCKSPATSAGAVGDRHNFLSSTCAAALLSWA